MKAVFYIHMHLHRTGRRYRKIGYRAESAPIASYCVPYDFLSQFTVNRCPLMTLAFPVRIFQKWGVIFNEELNVMEDWEYFTRTASICGVSDCCEPTAILPVLAKY